MSAFTVGTLVALLVAILACVDWGAPMIAPCGRRLLWIRVARPSEPMAAPANMSSAGTASAALVRCIRTIEYTFIMGKTVPLNVADTLAAAPFPGTMETCTPLLRAYPVWTYNVYLAFWLPTLGEDTTSIPHAICDADLV